MLKILNILDKKHHIFPLFPKPNSTVLQVYNFLINPLNLLKF